MKTFYVLAHIPPKTAKRFTTEEQAVFEAKCHLATTSDTDDVVVLQAIRLVRASTTDPLVDDTST